MIKFRHSGNFNKTEKFFTKSLRQEYRKILHRYGAEGVHILANATPQDTGETAKAWSYQIGVYRTGLSLTWTNSNVTSTGIPIVILLQYGHATGQGGYVEGRDFINPATKPLFDRLSEDLWREVRSL